MNCYTRAEKISMFVEELMAKVRIAVEVTVIVAGVVALVAMGFMSKRITELENDIKEYEMEKTEEMETSDEWIVVRDGLTGEVIYSGWK